MDVYSAISARKTMRDFDGRPIPTDTLRRLIAAGLQAPSNDHLRRWEFIVVADRQRREDLICRIAAPRTPEGALQVVDEWGLIDPSQRQMYIDAIPKQHAMILNAGCLVLPCFFTHSPLLQPESLSALNPYASIWCCIENILVAAAAEGIFGVTRIPFEEERTYLKTALHLPTGYEVACYLALGYPKPGARRQPQIDVRLDEKIHWNEW